MQEARDDETLDLEVLEAAAEEVGIDRALVRRAAWEEGVAVASPPRSLGLPTKVVRRRWLEGQLNPKKLERLMTRLDAFFGASGERKITGDSATWSARHVHVTFEGQDDGALVQISERFVNTANSTTAAGGMFGLLAGLSLMLVAGGFLGKGLLFGLVAIPIVVLGIATGVFFARKRVHRLMASADQSFAGALRSLEEANAAAKPDEV